MSEERAPSRSLSAVAVCTQEIETLPHGKSKGLGMCVGPLFSEAPFFADFLTWYLDLGVDRFFMYASHTDWLLKWVRMALASSRTSVGDLPNPSSQCIVGTRTPFT